MLDHSEDIALTFGDESENKKKLIKHPFAAFFHVFFRLAALICYFIMSLFTSSFVMQFIIMILLLSFDFWVIKNVTGRLLVGLRWWNFVDEDGNSQWVFESRKKKKGTASSTLAAESRIFWLSLVIFPIIWVFLFIIALISLKLTSVLVILVAMALTSANLIGYVKCKKDAGKDMKKMAGTFLGQQIMNQMMGRTTQEASDI